MTHPALDELIARTVDLYSRDELRKKLDQAEAEGRPLRIKYGADPSAPDIHLGHVVGLNKLRTFQDAGHTVVFIIGDFTGMIGDPSGRSQTRKPLSREDVNRNADTYKDQVFRILDPEKTEMRFNSEWCSPLHFDDVLRLTADCTVAQMLARDDFSKRYRANQPISLVEFMYPIIQAYDSVVIEADVELGGTDQLFNLLLGREMQKEHGQDPQVVMTLPLIEGLDGVQKMSKSLNNYVGITEEPRDMFGKLMSISDELMWRYFDYVLTMPPAEIDALRTSIETGERHPKDVKDELARAVVARFHDRAAAQDASEHFQRVFSQRETPDDMPEHAVPSSLLDESGQVGMLDLLTSVGFASSNSDARRLIQQGGVKLDDERVSDPKDRRRIAAGTVLRVGKRKFARITG